MEDGQRPEWKKIIDRSLIYKSYWAQRNFLVLRIGALERNFESSDGQSKIV
jgi:hypothetical protein